MDKKVYVFGHQNPDTDSICAAISYSYLKSKIDESHEYIPVALKEVNQETAFVLDYFHVDAPRVIHNLKPQVSDIKLLPYEYVQQESSLMHTLQVITKQIGRSVPVVDNNERLIGVVSISDIVPRLFQLNDKDILKKTVTPIENMIHNLDLYPIHHEKEYTHVTGDVYLSTDIHDFPLGNGIEFEDVIICNKDEVRTYIGKTKLLIVGGVVEKEKAHASYEKIYDTLSKEAKKSNIFCSKKSVLEIVKLLAHTTPIGEVVKKDKLVYFVTYETIDDVKENMMSSPIRRFPVVDEYGKIMGMISRSDLLEFNRKKAILVDHNERGQSIEGIEDIEILEIIDHHRVADVQTISPLYFRVEPVGCTCTIIARMFEEEGIELPYHIAGLMLSAILSDTLLFNSPTCTPLDKKVAVKLAKQLKIDPTLYGMKMITEGSNIQAESPQDILAYDRKKFMFGSYKVTIAQVNTGDFDGFFKILEDTISEMERICCEGEFDLFVLMVTDVVIGGTELIAIGDAKWIAENAFNIPKEEQSVFLPNVFSRKKQVVPNLMNAAKL